MARPNHFYIYVLFGVILGKLCDASPLRGNDVQLVKKGEFPFIVSLSIECPSIDKNNHICGGALISKRHVLTSAHCIEDMYIFCTTVIVNSIDFESGRIHQIKSWITYDLWAQDNNIIPEYIDNDIAIITLAQDAPDITPGVISKLTKKDVIGRKVVTAGWGFVDESNSRRFSSLRKAYLKVLNRKEYTRNEMKLFNMTGSPFSNIYLTWASPPAVITRGDSGSPLLLKYNNEIVGINESKYDVEDPESNPNVMSFHVAVDCYRDFIESFINTV